MLDAHAVERPTLRARAIRLAGRGGNSLRVVATDRTAMMVLLWALVAFVGRPILIGAHQGDAGAVADWLRSRMDVYALARSTGVVEWLSFALLGAVMAMGHVRLATVCPADQRARLSLVAACAYAVALPLAFILFLWNHSTVITLMVHDTLIFADAVNRIQAGLVPSVDFHTPFGLAALYGPAFGAWLSGGYAGAIEIASALLSMALGLACAYACRGRLTGSAASVLVVLVFLIATPMGLLSDWPGVSYTLLNGDPFLLSDNLTHAMFYNRWGWAALVVLFAFLAPREDQRPRIGELVVFAAILVFLFYLKLSYFVVGLGVAGAYALMNANLLRTLAIGGGAVAAGIVILGAPSGNLPAYLADVRGVASVSANRLGMLAPILRAGMEPVLLSIAPFVLIGLADKLQWKDWLAAAVMLLGSLFIIMQNAQTGYICTLIGMAAYGMSRLRNVDAAWPRHVALGIFVLLAAPPALERMTVFMDRSTAIRREEARPPAEWAHLAGMERFYVPERERAFDFMPAIDTPSERAEAVGLVGALGRRQDLRQGEYMETVMAGMDDLRGAVLPGDSIVTLDMANPFTVLLGTRPAEGDWLSMHKDRTINSEFYPAPEGIFADADHVMIARVSMLQSTAALVEEVYGEWLSEHYVDRLETTYWVRYSRKRSPGAS